MEFLFLKQILFKIKSKFIVFYLLSITVQNGKKKSKSFDV